MLLVLQTMFGNLHLKPIYLFFYHILTNLTDD